MLTRLCKNTGNLVAANLADCAQSAECLPSTEQGVRVITDAMGEEGR